MNNIPKEKHICKFCSMYGNSDTEADVNDRDICYDDIHEYVEAEDEACPNFDYDDTFIRH